MDEQEIWKDIPNYKGYKISNLGRILSFKRVKPIILKHKVNKHGYLYVVLVNSLGKKYKTCHQLVAEGFLNHVPNKHKMVVNHKDFNRLNNNLNNLEVTTQRENANRKHIASTSQYTGVCWHKRDKRWVAQIRDENRNVFLGNFKTEYAAHLAYEYELKNIKSR